MLDRRCFLSAVIVGLNLSLVGGASAATQSPPTLFGAEQLNTAGAEAERIARRAGLWDVVETVWSVPGALPTVTRGLVAERFMFGSMLQEVIRPLDDAGHKAVVRTDMLNFNRMEGRWSYVSLDTRVPVGLMPAWSNDRGTAEQIAFTFMPFAVPGPNGAVPGQFLRMEQTIRFVDDRHDVKDQYFTLADGTATRWLAHRYAFTRREPLK